MKGIDVSENNGIIDWQAVKSSGVEFVIIRLGYGNNHLDSRFYDNVNGALDSGLKIGVYYYSYALNEDMARHEAEFVIAVLRDCGLTPDRLEMGVWFDMEDSDGYKSSNYVTDSQEITNICSVFINTLWRDSYYSTGLYASYDWLTNKIYVDQLGGCAIWVAQYNATCDYEHADIWQYTDSLNIGGRLFDGNVEF